MPERLACSRLLPGSQENGAQRTPSFDLARKANAKMTGMATILDHIGNTPLLRLRHVSDALGVDIFVKCEFTNPGGSIKDRMALCMIEEAEKRGDLKPGGTIVDQSTGNTGPALSFVGNVKGYKVQIFLPAQLSSAYDSADRIRISQLYGANVTPVDLNEHMENADRLHGVERAATFVAIRMKQARDSHDRSPQPAQRCQEVTRNRRRDGENAQRAG